MTKKRRRNRTAKTNSKLRLSARPPGDLGCDADEERFKDALRTLAKAKPQPER